MDRTVDTSIAVNTEIKFLARNNGSAPKNARYEWDFGNNKTFTSSDTFFVYKYEEIGDFDVSLKVTDLDQNKIVAEVQTTIHVTIWPKIAITLKGMNTTPPSTIKTSDGIDIPAIVWSNKVESTAPAIKWNKNNFETEFTFSQGQATYICRISGTMSDDFKKVNYLSAIYTGSAFEGLWTYQSAIVLQDFPMDVWQPGKLIGKILTGPDAQAKVKQLSYQENYEFQGMPMERHLGSVDWSSNQTELSIFFYDR
ncbi:MAG: PKD domain-containing protein [Bacteroidetes bacterium]|nr:PKD domain-containing protein [Bacteroidota bacterium]